MSLVEKCWMVTSKISVIALLMITGIYFGKFVCPYIKKKKGAVAVSIVYITIMLVLYMIPPQIDNFSFNIQHVKKFWDSCNLIRFLIRPDLSDDQTVHC